MEKALLVGVAVEVEGEDGLVEEGGDAGVDLAV